MLLLPEACCCAIQANQPNQTTVTTITTMMRTMRISAVVAAATAFLGCSTAFSPLTLPTKTTTSSQPSILNSPLEPLVFRNHKFSSLLIERQAMLQQTELPQKLYIPKQKEIPKVLGGVKIGLRKLVVITGASSGLGLSTAVTLSQTGRYFVVMACRDVEKGKKGE